MVPIGLPNTAHCARRAHERRATRARDPVRFARTRGIRGESARVRRSAPDSSRASPPRGDLASSRAMPFSASASSRSDAQRDPRPARAFAVWDHDPENDAFVPPPPKTLPASLRPPRSNDAWLLEGYGAPAATWRQPSISGTPPAARSFHACVAVGGKGAFAVVAGGIDVHNRHLNDVQILHAPTDDGAWTWTQVKQAAFGRPSPRASPLITCVAPASAAAPTSLMLFGGSSGWSTSSSREKAASARIGASHAWRSRVSMESTDM